jgi:hypothetical protein
MLLFGSFESGPTTSVSRAAAWGARGVMRSSVRCTPPRNSLPSRETPP